MNPSVFRAALATFAVLWLSLSGDPAPAGQPDPTDESSYVTQTVPAAPPIAEKRPTSFTRHGITVTDDYAWLHDPAYPQVTDEDVLDYLKAENAWFEARMAPHQGTVDALFTEMRGRIKEADTSVPQKDGDYLYWVEFEEGAEYRKWWRRPVAGGADELLIDENELAKGLEYFKLGTFSVSQNGRLLAYSVDVDGSERFTVRVKNLESGDLLADEIPGVNSGIVWTEGDRSFVYGPVNDNWRIDHIRLHRLGDAVERDVELYRESDIGFNVGHSLSNNEKWLIIATGDHETSEVRMVPADNPTAEPILVRERVKGVEYDIDERNGTLFIHTNDTHVNFRVATAPVSDPANWSTLIEGSDDFYLTGLQLFQDFFVTEGRLNGLDQVQIRTYEDATNPKPITFPEAAYSAGLDDNPEWDVAKIRLSYESMVTPDTIYDYHLASGELEVLKVQEIPSGYDASLYTTERLFVTARDGTQVPVSVMYRKDRPMGGPLHIYAYGAYGYAMQPGFSTTRLSLVDRGFAYAIAHIRGGDEMGRQWYLDGKLEKRTNSFNDFVDVTRGLIERGYSVAGKVSASGGSAGGELMGAIVNQAPELYGAVAAHVPFVDVLNTMLDESLPLTPGEWPEWGNPITDAEAFRTILSYSPYDQVTAQDYPPLLVTAGLNDPRVTYWEPAKWVARLRATKTDGNELLLKTNMGAGHGGKSGRFESLRETAEEFAFILWQIGGGE